MCFYPHWSRDSVFPVCGILSANFRSKNLTFAYYRVFFRNFNVAQQFFLWSILPSYSVSNKLCFFRA